MSREPDLFLEDIVLACDRIASYTLGVTIDGLRANAMLADAVVRNLEVVGEAAKRLPDDLRARHTDVPWRKMAAMRDVLSHGYFGVDLDLVWDVVQKEIPVVRVKVGAILARVRTSSS